MPKFKSCEGSGSCLAHRKTKYGEHHEERHEERYEKCLFSICICLCLNWGHPEALHDTNVALIYAKQANIPEAAAKEQVDRMMKAIKSELVKGNEVVIQDFGRFYVSQRAFHHRDDKSEGSAKEMSDATGSIRRYARFNSAPHLKDELNEKKKN